MILGILQEIKDGETRVALLPEQVKACVRLGHEVWVQRGAGKKIGIADKDYQNAGAKIVSSPATIWKQAELVLKVKEPLPQEFAYFHPRLNLFCFLHLAANLPLQRALQKSRAKALGFEALRDEAQAGFPLLKPMSEIAGRLSILLGAGYLRTDQGGCGVLLSPTSSSDSARVAVVGAGNVGSSAAELAWNMGAQVRVLDQNSEILARLERAYPGMKAEKSTASRITAALKESHLVIGAVYRPGAKTPQVIRKEMVQGMKAGSVLVDVAIDQGGASETSRPTSISHPTYRQYGVIHSAIPNLPALVGRTASESLSRALWIHALSKLKEESGESALFRLRNQL